VYVVSGIWHCCVCQGIVSELDPQAVTLRMTRPGDAEEARGVHFLHAHEDCLLMAFPNMTLGLEPNVP
jgi:hypothetical protein